MARWQEIESELREPWEAHPATATLALIDACKRIAELEAVLRRVQDETFEHGLFCAITRDSHAECDCGTWTLECDVERVLGGGEKE